jgi:hypothetical protein
LVELRGGLIELCEQTFERLRGLDLRFEQARVGFIDHRGGAAKRIERRARRWRR